MPTDFAFRFATYLTLLLACACAGYSEWDFLREVSIFTGFVAVAMGIAFVCDHRGYTVSLQMANLVGGGIFLLAVLWFGFHYRNPDSLLNTLPWPAGGLPYIVGLMMVLVPAKLIRPKHVGDWWALQGLGLSMVAVGGAMTDDALYMVLLALYSVVGVWSLALFYIRRVSGHVPPPPPFAPVHGWRKVFSPQTYLPAWFFVARSRPTLAEPFAGVGQPTPTERLGRSHFSRAVRWVFASLIFTLPLFFFSPRTEGLRWELFPPRMETGISKNSVDLSRTGDLRPNPKPAFTITVTRPDGSPAELPANQRFRVSGHSSYFHQQGRWNRTSLGHLYPIPQDGRGVWPPTSRVPPQDYGRDTVLLEYELEEDTYGSPMADPIFHRPGQPAPIFFSRHGQFEYATAQNNGSFRIPNYDITDRLKIRHYWQYHKLSTTHEPGARWRLHDRDPAAVKSRLPLLDLTSKPIAKAAKSLLERLIREGRLSRAILERANAATLLPAPEDHLAVAQAFEEYFAKSGEFEYTLNLRRHDRSIDPVEDFLFYTKSGHCERFASALTLLLRGVGIPSQFVVGYQGCITVEEGRFLVRQDHAHAWVEILVSKRVPDTDERDWYWTTLDPTAPSSDDGAGDETASTSGQFINAFITGLTPERQKQLIDKLQELATQNVESALLVLGIGVAAVVVVVLLRRRLRRPAPPPAAPEADPVPWFSKFVGIMDRAGVAWQPGQSPAEFARLAGAWLAENPRLTNVAGIPEQISHTLDRHRYAGAALTPDDIETLHRHLQNLEAALSSRKSSS